MHRAQRRSIKGSQVYQVAYTTWYIYGLVKHTSMLVVNREKGGKSGVSHKWAKLGGQRTPSNRRQHRVSLCLANWTDRVPVYLLTS